jgi:2-oxoglutarate ferredoxin oxidoreductase subunit alpha
VKSGGYFLYDSTKKLAKEFLRDDINYIEIPLKEISNSNYSDPRQRQLFKNIIYVGALCELLKIEFNVFEDLFAEQFKGKEKLIPLNVTALQLGMNYIKDYYPNSLNIKVERRDLLKNKILAEGNAACALGAVYGGATFAAWYPITPSTSVIDGYADYCKQFRIDKETGRKNYAIIQAEDELAAMGMVLGAMWNGARAFTSTSGPGLSLMNEFLGLAYFAEIPAVLIDVQRTGPSTGMPTRTQQSDVLEAAYASHGDTKHVLLFPSNPKECFDMTADAFDLAEHLQTPIIMLTDLDLGMNDHISEPYEWNDLRQYNRGKVLTAEGLDAAQNWGRYLDVDGDGIPYRTLPGTHPEKGSFFTRGSSHTEYAAYTESSDEYRKGMERLLKKWVTAKTLVPSSIVYPSKNKSDTGVIFFGTSTYSAEEAMDKLAEKNIHVDALRLRGFPFDKVFEEFVSSHKQIFVIEQNRDAQLKSLMMIELGTEASKLHSVLNFDGMPITADFIFNQIASSFKAQVSNA